MLARALLRLTRPVLCHPARTGLLLLSDSSADLS
jgi:hypothetical protein